MFLSCTGVFYRKRRIKETLIKRAGLLLYVYFQTQKASTVIGTGFLCELSLSFEIRIRD